MKETIKRLLSALLVLVMVVGLVPMSSITAEAATRTVYFTAPDSWTEVGAYMWNSSKTSENTGTPKKMTQVVGQIYTINITNDNYNMIIFANAYEKWKDQKTSDLNIPSDLSQKNMYDYEAEKWSLYSSSSEDQTTTETRTIYLDTTKYVGGWSEAYAYVWIDGEDGSGKTLEMTETSKDGVFKVEVPVTYTNIIFKPNQNNWSGQTNSQTIPSVKNLFTCTAFSSITSGTWGTYTTSDTDNNFPSNVTGKVTFFDLYTDTEIKQNAGQGEEYYGLNGWGYMSNGQSVTLDATKYSFTSIGRAFSNNVNPAIKTYWGNSKVSPLFFGNFQPYYNIYNDNAQQNLAYQNPWWVDNNNFKQSNSWDANRQGYMDTVYGSTNHSTENFSYYLNRSIDVENDADKYGAVVLGIVGDSLVNGNIVANGTTTVLPQFNERFYIDNPTIGKMYETMEFPFVVREINGANYYQFDSGVGDYHDTVRMNDEGTGLIYSSAEKDVVYGITAEGNRTPGFFPFNDPSDTVQTSYKDSDGNTKYDYSSSENNLNYGFGMKLEIEFTIDEDGCVYAKDNKTRVSAIFEFSGDDDVWIYVDGKLALDMGGDHGVAEGKLNFSNNTATVQYVKTINGKSQASEALAIEDTYDNEDYINKNASVSENVTQKFEIDKSDPTKIHTLTIFYEERGMFESNFKATFNLEQPTVLKTTNTVNVENVNTALQKVTAEAAVNDTFTFEINDENSADVTGKKYTTESGETANFNGTMKLGNGDSATFTKQFSRAEELELIQAANDKYDTTWTMSELSDSGLGSTIAASYQDGKDSLSASDGRVTEEEASAFKLENADNGANRDVPAKVQVDYVQTPKTGGVAIQKTMSGTTETDAVFDFKVTLSNVFDGGSEEAAYDLVYDVYSYDGEGSKIVRKNAIATDGVVQLKAGQFALINGIPVGTDYKVVENSKGGYELEELDVTTNINNDKNVTGTVSTGTVTGTVAADTASNVDMFVYTNSIVTLKDSFLIEVGKENTLNVIPSASNDGTLSGDLEDIYNDWTGSEATSKGFVFIVDDEPYVDGDGKPKTEVTVGGVTYKVSYDANKNPVITVTPGEEVTENVISVKYQLVELNADGTVKYQDYTDDSGEETKELQGITGVITMKNYLYKSNDDVYVLDYGLDVDLAENTGDGLFENDSLANPKLEGTTSTYWNTAKKKSESTATADTKSAQNTSSVQGDYGTIIPSVNSFGNYTISENVNPTITYSLDKFLEGNDWFNYGVMIQKGDADVSEGQTSNRFRLNVTSNIRILPAEVVYYEDNFNSDTETKDSSVKIIYSGEEEDITTSGTSLTLTQSNGQTEQYGHDEAYTSGTGDSAGSSTALTANGYKTKAIFTFKGTGFDVVGRTTTSSAGIIYTVEQETGVDEDGEATWTLFKTGAVDTYYANGDLYQIPVIHEDLGVHATYRVTLGIKATGTDNEKVTFYLDGIRIYNTLDVDGDEAYIDNEEGVTIVKVGDLIIGDGEITETGIVDEDGETIVQGQSIQGSKAALVGNTYNDPMFEALGYTKTEDINEDAVGSNITNSLLQYMHSGPNNEIYLDETASIAFIAEGVNDENSTIQIEAKLVNTDGSGVPTSDGVDLRVWNGEEFVLVETVKSATAMYYKINLDDCIELAENRYLVLISGNSDVEEEGTSSLSFSNLKYKGYTLKNPLDTAYTEDIKEIISTDTLSESVTFVEYTGTFKIRKNQWINHKYAVTLSQDVFEGGDPEFTMYYTNNGVKTEITVTAARSDESDCKYTLRFKAPNAVGTFPIEIHYVLNGAESEEYLATTMKVNR